MVRDLDKGKVRHRLESTSPDVAYLKIPTSGPHSGMLREDVESAYYDTSDNTPITDIKVP